MNITEIINNKFAEPATIISVNGSNVSVYDINDKFLNELEINIPKDEFLDGYADSLIEDSSFDLFTSSLNKCLHNKEEITVELECSQVINCCGNDKIYIRCRLIPIDEQHVFMGIRNITTEKSNLDTLVESERRFKIASEQINIYYWEYTVATREMRPCFRCMRDLGLPALVKNYPEPAIEAGIFPQDYADMYRDWHKQIANGVKELEAVIPLTVGRVPFRVKYTTEFDANGKPYKAYGSATLISAEELTQRKISNSIIEGLAQAYDMITLVDYETGQITPIKDNPNAQLNNANDFEGSMKEFLTNFEIPGDDNIYRLADLNYLRNEMFIDTDKREIDFREKNVGIWLHNTYIVVERNGQVVNKALTSSSVMDKDAARRMEAERIIAKQKVELEKAVEAANSANRAKSDFLARMSHEIRTPLNAIMGMNEIIVKSTEDPIIKSYADDAYKAATGLLGTINEILDFSKIESGKMELVEDDFYFSPFLGNLYTMFALRAEDKNLALIFDIDENLPSGLYGDDTHLRQVLTNLLSNAIKYTENGSVTLKITESGRMGTTQSESISLKFCIKDTGRGIKQEDIKKLFEAFERFDLKDNKSIEGTGLGMNIVSGLLDIMGSTLKVESEYGHGSTFSFVVNMGVSNNTPLGDFRKSLDKKPAIKETKLYINPDKRVLVVDDNSVNLKVIKALLKATKVMVDTATSGADALEMTKEQKYDLIFLDHYMPQMDGIETMENLKKQNGINNDTPVIALTANAIKGAENIYYEHGFRETVFKPTTQQVLSDTLNKYLSS